MFDSKQIPYYLLSFGFVAIVAGLGSYFTKTDNEWYECVKSKFTPPKIVFPIVWTLLYILIAIALARQLPKKDALVLAVYFVNLALNVVWCYLYFDKKDLTSAFATVVVILATALALLAMTYSWLLIPYCCWIAFATFLNGWSMYRIDTCQMVKNID